MEIFSSEKITDRITRITEITGTHMYLAEGTDRAILIVKNVEFRRFQFMGFAIHMHHYCCLQECLLRVWHAG